MLSATGKEFKLSLAECIKVLRSARKQRANLNSHSYYAEKFRSNLANLRKSFLKLQRNYPQEKFPSVAFQISVIVPLINKLIEIYPAPINQMFQLLNEIKFKDESDLTAEIEILESKDEKSISPPFLPDDLIEERFSILKKILWEINRTYESACYNSCAAMIRRLTETIIIEAYEHHNLRNLIIDSNGAYLRFDDLIGKASSQVEFRLTRETKRVLPDLKFFGDMGAHNRMALVRKTDLDRLHNAIRIAIEELLRNI